MRFHSLTNRARLTFLTGVLQRRNLGRRRRRWRAEQVCEDPLAAQHRRGPVGIRSHRQDTGLTEETSTLPVIERHSPKVVAIDIGNSVMLRQTFVHERVVGSQQLHHAAIARATGCPMNRRFPAASPRAGSHRIPDTHRHPARGPPACPVTATVWRSCLPGPAERGSSNIRRTCLARIAGSLSFPRIATSRSSSSGMLLHRKNDNRDASVQIAEAIDRPRRLTRRAPPRCGKENSATPGFVRYLAGCRPRIRLQPGRPHKKLSSRSRSFSVTGRR